MKETFSCVDGRSMLDDTRATVFSGMGGDSGRRRYVCPPWHVTATLNALGALVGGVVGGVDNLKHDLECDVCLIFPSFVGIAAHCCHLVLALLLVRRISVGGLGHGQRRRIVVRAQINARVSRFFLCRGHRVVRDQSILYFTGTLLLLCCYVTLKAANQVQTNIARHGRLVVPGTNTINGRGPLLYLKVLLRLR